MARIRGIILCVIRITRQMYACIYTRRGTRPRFTADRKRKLQNTRVHLPWASNFPDRGRLYAVVFRNVLQYYRRARGGYYRISLDERKLQNAHALSHVHSSMKESVIGSRFWIKKKKKKQPLTFRKIMFFIVLPRVCAKFKKYLLRSLTLHMYSGSMHLNRSAAM